ncbi:MAG: D-lyxose/D-mannose family sugar isomerase [Clostridiales bacterium]|nr:D-lyxose/D-mannose family sugar isomerase [Clostridiales bacterium]
MKRSDINRLIQEAIEFFDEMNFKLPPFAFWGVDEWDNKNHEYDEIRANKLGWDVTDYGSDDFMSRGLLLFTIRNGNPELKDSKSYAEKIMVVREGQITPCHFHWKKKEDIINRGGGNLLIRLHNSTEDGELADSPVQVHIDGRSYEVPAGTVIRLTPGESITLMTGQYHSFWGEPGFGTVLVGEVSECNDDFADNRFYENVGRFPDIEEDETTLFYLCNEYPKA